MKEFIRTLKQVHLASGSEMLGYLIITVAGGIFGIILTLCILFFAGNEDGYGQIGAMLALMLGYIFCGLAGSLTMANDFNLAIAMGKTRKHFILAKYLLIAGNMLMTLVVALLIGLFENWIYTTIYPGIGNEFDVTGFLLKPGVILCAVFFLSMLTLLLGSILLKYSTKAFTIIWLGWMVICFGITRLSDAMVDGETSALKELLQNTADFVGKFSALQISLFILVLSAAGVAAAFAMVRKQRITV